MLLSVETINHPKYGSLLECWFIGSMHKLVHSPFKPYFYSYEPLSHRGSLHGTSNLKRTLSCADFLEKRFGGKTKPC